MSPSQESPPLPRPLKALLVDDERVTIERFRLLLAPHAEIEVVATATSAAAARARLITPCTTEFPGPIDVVFLDVEMPGETGIAVLPSVPKETVVVFVTAFPQYAIQAFQVGAIDYLLKPIDPERLEQTIDRIVKLVPLLRAEPGDENDDDSADPVDSSGKHAPLASTATLRVPLVGGGGIQEVRIGTICWIEGMRNYSRVALRDPQRLHIFRRRLADWQSDLPEAMFARISKSILINKAILSKSEWRSRDETLLSFAGREDALTIGRLAAVRLREILGALERPVEKVLQDLFPLGRPQEKPRVSWVDGRRIRRPITTRTQSCRCRTAG
jgi:two-component system, LytTR family, response regulator